MQKNGLFFFALILVVLSGCGPSREKSAARIVSLEKSLYSPQSSGLDKVKADSLLIQYTSFIKHFPDDTMSVKYLFNAANLCMNMSEGSKAIDFFNQFIQKYPDNPRVGTCMFFKAYIYENQLKDLEKAKEMYLQFIEKFPDSDFSKDARMAIKNLGKSPDEIVREFEEQRKADSIRIADSITSLEPHPKGRKNKSK
jgi:outer membrane protein assembly factor BamD (BamD/ComL family)